MEAMSLALLANSDLVTQYMGMVVRAGLGNSCALAQADERSRALNILGVRPTDVASGASGVVAGLADGMLVRLDGAAADGALIYLSAATAGLGTAAAPDVPVVLGKCYHTHVVAGVTYAELVMVTAPPKVPPGIIDIPGASYQVTDAASSDLCSMVELGSDDPVTVTVPKQATTPLPVGFASNFQQKGAGKVTFAPEDGAVTIEPAGTLSISAQWKAASLIKIGPDSWALVGSLGS